MKRIILETKHKRGCGYCLEYIPSKKVGNTVKYSRCPYDECPYHELDDVKLYDEYVDGISDLSIATLMATLCGKRKKFVTSCD